MADIVKVKFRPRGKSVYCEAGESLPAVGDYVVVDTGRGLEVAKVVGLEGLPRAGEELMKIVRPATGSDLEEARQKLEKEALAKCKEMVAELGLKMKPLIASYDLTNERVSVLFSAEERVDFRELVRKLGHALETRVELKQLGARDEAKLLGSLGRCGYPLCCRTFLTSFTSVSIKTAKEQDLALNPMKISGICGRLLCCLTYEAKEYAEMKRMMPRLNQEIQTPWGKGRVVGINVPKETVTVQLIDSDVIKEVPLDELAHARKES